MMSFTPQGNTVPISECPVSVRPQSPSYSGSMLITICDCFPRTPSRSNPAAHSVLLPWWPVYQLPFHFRTHPPPPDLITHNWTLPFVSSLPVPMLSSGFNCRVSLFSDHSVMTSLLSSPTSFPVCFSSCPQLFPPPLTIWNSEGLSQVVVTGHTLPSIPAEVSTFHLVFSG